MTRFYEHENVPYHEQVKRCVKNTKRTHTQMEKERMVNCGCVPTEQELIALAGIR